MERETGFANGTHAREGRCTPNDMERDAQALLDKLIPERDAETDKAKRKQLSSRIKTARMMRNWAKTRAGYRSF